MLDRRISMFAALIWVTGCGAEAERSDDAPLLCPEAPASIPGPAPEEMRPSPAACPSGAAAPGPWHGRATHVAPADAVDTRIVGTEVGPAVYWRVGDDHFVSMADPATGRWGPDRLVATDAAAFNQVIPVCDGVLVDLVDENDRPAMVHLHLARPGAETVSRTMGATHDDHFGTITHRAVFTATQLEIDIRDGSDSCYTVDETEPLDVRTLVSLSARAGQYVPEERPLVVPKTRLVGTSLTYAFRGLGDAFAFEQEGPVGPTFTREIPLPSGGAVPWGAFETAIGPAGELFLYVPGRPDDGPGRLLQLDANGRRVRPDRRLDAGEEHGVSLLSWPGGVALGIVAGAEATVIGLDDPELVPDLDGPCMTDALGRCGVGTFEVAGGGWRCVTPAAVEETCNAADDDCDGLTDEAPAGCDFHWRGPAVSPPPRLSCQTELIPWPEVLWASSPNPDPCQAFTNERPCLVGEESIRYDAAGNLIADALHTYTWADGRLMGWEGTTLEYDGGGRLVAQNNEYQPRWTFEYDDLGRLVVWGKGDWTTLYEWAADGSAVTVRSAHLGEVSEVADQATLVDGYVAAVDDGQFASGGSQLPGDPRCGGLIGWGYDGGGAGLEEHESWGREDVMDSAGRVRASAIGRYSLRDDSNPYVTTSDGDLVIRFDPSGRPEGWALCADYSYTGICLEGYGWADGAQCRMVPILYDCPP